MIKFIEQEPVDRDEYCGGDFVYGKADILLKPFEKSIVEGLNPLILNRMGLNPWTVLKSLPQIDKDAINQLLIDCQYRDIVVDRVAHAIYPYTIFSKDASQYFTHFDVKPYYYDMITDMEWNLSPNTGTPLSAYRYPEDNLMYACQYVCIGSGYTHYCLPHDGSRYLEPFLIEMSNGDYLYVIAYMWYNK